jgi:hypothetical protein
MKINCCSTLATLAVVLQACGGGAPTKPIALNAENPHYFQYKDKPLILITSGEHYGALMNLDFDYHKYFETLSSDSLNLTRLMSGSYVEPAGAFRIEGNTLAPKSGRYICPWKRSDAEGYANGGYKFDLSQWDEAYFARLKDLMSDAEKKNIIVEFTLFCPFYGDEQWNLSPMNNRNNIQGGGPGDRTHVYTMDKSASLLAVQENLVRKIVGELKDYSNLIYEICNEPYFGGVTMEWQHHMASLIRDEEKDFAQPHLISQNIANGSQRIANPHPAVSVFNFHYATPPVTVGLNYHLNKVIGDNETGFEGNADSTYRKEGWAFILAGGGLYNNLDYSFTAGREDGSFQYPSTQPGGGSAALREQLAGLRKFIGAFTYTGMKPDTTVATGWGFRTCQVLAEKGKQYAIYIFGKGPFDLQLSIPSGEYDVAFLDPLTLASEAQQRHTSDGHMALTTPAYAEDVAIKIVRTGGSDGQ